MSICNLYTLFLLAGFFFLSSERLVAQTYYPPVQFTAHWDTLSHVESGFCNEKIDSLYAYLNRKNTKSLIILLDGKIALEKYFGTFTVDSFWYYASAGKSLMSFLLGVAQQEGLLNIDSPASKYLGTYWTSCTSEQEKAITVRHQMAMSTGLDDQIKPSLKYPDPFNCMDSGCLKYLTDPFNRWFYFNGPYRLTQDIMEKASRKNKNTYSLQKLNPIGWQGLWINYVLYGRARDMARFGHLVLNRGIWDGDSILKDQDYYEQMISSSQEINPAYGLLWWLNGKSKYILPGSTIEFAGSLIPSAPEDMYAALGKDDQKIYIVPSLKMVVVRQGKSSGIPLYAKSTFDDELWHYINQLNCNASVKKPEFPRIEIIPNPASDYLWIKNKQAEQELILYSMQGEVLLKSFEDRMDIRGLSSGLYFIIVRGREQYYAQKIRIEP